jgi:GH25 family lysozyme M1 (1,4-beta-N-acetylmuramidase)/LysM repeat protein
MTNKLKKIVASVALSVVMILSFAVPSFAQTGKVDFFDVSHYQAENGLPLSWFQTIKRGNINGVILKASDGNRYQDKSFAVNYANAVQAKVRVSAYHYGRLTSNQDAKNEALWFDSVLQSVHFSKQDSYAILDIEQSNLTHDRTLLTEYCNTFIKTLQDKGYSKISIYSGNSYYQNRLIPSKLIVKNPWIARYSSSGKDVIKPTVSSVSAHQWTSSYYIEGFGRFDANIDYTDQYSKEVSSSVGKIVTGTVKSASLVNYLKSKGMKWAFTDRAKLAVQYGLVSSAKNYVGSSAQNLSLLSLVKKGVKPVKQPKAPVIKQRNPSQYLSKNTKKITTRHTVYLYNSTNFTKSHRVAKFKNNTIFTIKSSKLSANGTLRFLTKSNKYITANKKYVRIYSVKPQAKKIVKKVAHKTRVVKGDTLWEISKAKNISVSKLKKLNHLRSDLINIGQVLKFK